MENAEQIGKCHSCGASLEEIERFRSLRRVTSDCQPWPSGGRLYVCRSCGLAQKGADSRWHDEVEEIYRAYRIYHQSSGAEQAVFRQEAGLPSSRSESLLRHLMDSKRVPGSGRLLDFGCGNGSLLRSAGKLLPDWALFGCELNDKYRETVQSIENVEGFFACPAEDIPGTFDIITLVHTVEHILNPGRILKELGKKLSPNGLIFIETPDVKASLFDILVADHCSHFTVEALAGIVRNAGFKIEHTATDWVPKEISMIAVKSDGNPGQKGGIKPGGASVIRKNIEWLESVATHAGEISQKGDFGLFGTSIAATWLFGYVGDRVEFFVDEDPNRIGKTYMGRPVYPPDRVPRGCQVYMALPFSIAEPVARRLENRGITFHLPPGFDDKI